MSDEDLREEIRQLRADLDVLRDRVAALERSVEGEEFSAETTEAASARTAGTTPGDDEPQANESAETAGADWERNLGVKWLGVVGGIALVVGVFFFVQLAIEAGLLGHLGRVAIGTAGGLAMFGAGRFAAARQGYVRWGRIAAGIGLAITYFSVYAAYGFESYRAALGTPLWAVLAGLTVVVAGAAAVSIHDRAPVIAGEAFLLGYVTAYLGLALGAGTTAVTPVYALLLAGGLVAIARVRPWWHLVLASALPTYGVLWAWLDEGDPVPALAAGALLVGFVVYVAGGFVLRTTVPDERIPLPADGALTAVNGIAAAGLLEIVVREWFPDAPVDGVAIVGIGVLLAAVYAGTTARSGRRDEAAGGLAVVLVGVGLVTALGTFAATVGLLALLCVAFAVASGVGADGVRVGAHLLAAGIVYKLLVVDASGLPAFDPADPVATATGRAVAFAAAIAVFYGLAWWFSRREAPIPFVEDVLASVPYAWAGTGLAVAVLALELSGVGVSVAWALFGLGLAGVGLGADHGGLRLQGVAVLGLATVKVFVYDTRDLGPSARTLAFLVLGAILLLVSYGYARWEGAEPLGRFTRE